MKLILLVLPVILILTGCPNPVNQWQSHGTGDLKQIKGLEDCTYNDVFTGATHLHIVRCPNSTVSTKTSGKDPVTTITVDGTEYIPK